jgi:RHS repeat-associated protein
VDGVENRFVLDLSGKMERILCDVDAVGVVTAWYVHGPDLAFKVDAATNLTCYHADAMANIVATTDGTRATVNQYAYTPYGRSLGETNCSTPRLTGLTQNPYRFVGSQGVMEDLPDLYFMRARYYLAEAGVFLSTDPVKKIGPGWKTEAYSYAGENPMSFVDPDGREFSILTLWVIEQRFVRPANKLLSVAEAVSEVWATGSSEPTDYFEAMGTEATKQLHSIKDPVTSFLFKLGTSETPLLAAASEGADWLPFIPSIKAGVKLGNIYLNIQTGLERRTEANRAPVKAEDNSNNSASASGSALPKRYANAAAYAESVGVNYASSSKAIQAIYDRAQTAHNNLMDSISQGKRANESQSAYMDRLVNQMNKDLGLSTTPKAKEPPKKKKK